MKKSIPHTLKVLTQSIVILLSTIQMAKGQLPTVTSVNPLSASTGSAVTIKGTNFSSTAANDNVWFGGAKATVTAATTTSLTVTVPTGALYMPVSVENTSSHLTGSSLAPFLPTFNNSSYAAGTENFDHETEFAAGASTMSTALADIDGDGKLDIIVVNNAANTISVLRNTSTVGSIASGSFATKVDFATSTNPISVAVGDLDGDGKPDVVVGSQNSFTVSVLRNTSSSGSITLAPKVDFETDIPNSVAIGDIDGDGKPDIVTADEGFDYVSVFLNTSTAGSITSGSFATVTGFTANNAPNSVALGDIDGDGKLDVIVSDYNGATVSVYLNTSTSGSVSFSAAVSFTVGTDPMGIAVGDIDGDGKPDIVAVNYGSNTISLLRNTSTTGTPSFDAKVDFATGSSPISVAIGDLDGDGKPDIAVTVPEIDNVEVFRNTSTSGSITSGSLATKVNFYTPNGPFGVALGDLDGDGKPDIVATESSANSVSVLRNDPLSPIAGTLKLTCSTNSTSLSDAAAQGSWASGNLSVATVSGSGMVTGIGNGTAVITYTGSGSPGTPVNYVTAVVTVSAAVPPTITSVSPSVGYPLSSVTLTGTHFSTNSANDIVWFGATRATVTAASATELTVKVPTGATYSSVSVDTVGGCNFIGYSESPFLPTYNNSGDAEGTENFEGKVDFNTGSFAQGVAVGDIDGDGKPDIVVADYGGNAVVIFRNTSASGSIAAGSFGAGVFFSTLSEPYSVVIGDIDGDGKPDIAVADFGAASVSVFRNTSTSGSITSSSLGSRVDYTTGSGPNYLAIGDIDGDGKPDLAVTNLTSNTVSLFRNIATSGSITSGSFLAKVDLTTGTEPHGVVITDMDGDSKPELVIDNYGSNTVSVFRNTATSGSITSGSFAAKFDYATGISPWGLMTGDIDGDGKQDIIVTNYADSSFSVYRNTSTTGTIDTNSFSPKVDFAAVASCMHVAIGDIDGDGKPDIAVGNYQKNSVSLFRNTSVSGSITSSSFASAITFASSAGPWGIVLADVDGDGKPDLVVGNKNSSTVSVSRNSPLQPISGTLSLCGSGANVTLSNATSGGTWSSSNTSVATVGSNTGVVTSAGSGTAIITYAGIAGANFTGNYVTTTVTVNVLPTVGLTGGGVVCSGSTITLSGTGAVSYSWTGGITDGVAFTPSAGTTTYTVTGTDVNSCKNTATTTVTVNTLPVVGIAGGGIAVCSGSSVTLGGTGAVSYSWSGGITDGVGFIPSIGINSYTVTGTDVNSCTNTATTSVTVNNLPTIGITGGGVAICSGGSVTLSGTGAVSYDWSSGITDGVAFVPSTGASSYTVTGTDANNCTNTATTSVTVNTLPTIGATGGETAICLGGSVTLSGTGAVSYSWSGGVNDGVAFTPSAGTTTYTVTGTDVNNCTNTATTSVTVNALPIVGTTGGSVAICSGSSVTLSGTGAVSYSWSGGVTDGVSFMPSTGISDYTVTGTDANSCMNTATTNVTVNALPTVGITGGGVAICSGSTVTLSATGATSYSWSGGINNGVAFTPGIGYDTYTVTGTTSGCSNTAITTVTVNAPTAGTVTGATSVFTGSSITMSDPADDGAGTWSTSNGNATVAGGIVSGVTAGTVVISYGITNACGTIYATRTITVNNSIIPAPGTVCSGNSITLTNASTGGTWSMGSLVATIAPSTGVLTASAGYTGTATVTYTLAGVRTTQVVTVYPNPSPIQVAALECAGITTTLTDATPGGAWSGTGAATASGVGTSGIFVAGALGGTTALTYAMPTGCYTTISRTVYANPQPIMGNFNLCVGLVTILSDASPVSSWSSSSTAIAIASGGDISGEGAGVATITFKSSAAGNCITTQTVTVNAMPTITPINGPVSISHAGSPVSISDATAGGIWTSSNTNVIALSGSTGSPISATALTTTGSSVITYAVTIAGCTSKVTKTFGASTATHSTGSTTVFAGSAISISDDRPSGLWSSSDNGIATVDGNGLVTGIMPGNVEITHEITSDDGMASRNVTSVTVSAVPVLITVQPNPNRGTFRVRGTVGSTNDEAVTFEVTDLLGQVIYRNKVTAFEGRLDETILLSNALTNGMYLLNVHSGAENKTFQLVIEQ